MKDNKTFTLKETAEFMADAFLAPLYTWDNLPTMLSILHNSCPEIIIETPDGLIFNAKTALDFGIDLKVHFKTLSDFENSIRKAIIPSILKELEDDVEESNPNSLS